MQPYHGFKSSKIFQQLSTPSMVDLSILEKPQAIPSESMYPISILPFP